jgi:hypothetical protein
MPWRAGDLVHTIQSAPAGLVHPGGSALPLSRTLQTDGELAWFHNQHRDLGLVGADHTRLAHALGPAGAPELVGQLERVQQAMHQMHDMPIPAATADRVNGMRQLLDDVVGGRLGVAPANAAALDQYGAPLTQLAEMAQRAMQVQLAHQTQTP